MAIQDQTGAFIPTTNVWDTENEHIKDMDVTKPEFRELLVRLFQDLNRMALAVNNRDAGTYNVLPFVNGQTWFPKPGINPATQNTSQNVRPVYRKVINFGPLPAAGNTPIAHGITCTTATTFTRIYGVATKPTVPFSYIPIPYIDPAGANISLFVDNTNVNITVASDRSAYTICYVILEYLLY
jgi:hypothetical protein